MSTKTAVFSKSIAGTEKFAKDLTSKGLMMYNKGIHPPSPAHKTRPAACFTHSGTGGTCGYLLEGARMANIFDLFKKIGKKEPPAGPVTHIVAGLGNPGRNYTLTRHNAGFLALDHIAERAGASVDRVRFHALTGEAALGGARVLFLKPQTFMNNSGEAVREAAAFYKIPPERIVVLCDDVNFDVGRLRVRASGTDGGHNGLKSIIYQLNADTFPRIRIGVGKKPHPDYDLADWVLSAFTETEQKALLHTFGTVYEGLLRILAGDLPAAMQVCNGK